MPHSPDLQNSLKRLESREITDLKKLLAIKDQIDKNGALMQIRPREGLSETGPIVWEQYSKLLAKLKKNLSEAIEGLTLGISLPTESEISLAWIEKTFKEVNKYFVLLD